MKIKSISVYIYIMCIALAMCGCKNNPIEPKLKDFKVNAFISNIKSYNINAEFIDKAIPVDTSSAVKPYVAVQSWVIKGKDILMSITVPDDAEELYFGAFNSQAEYMGLKFSDQNETTVKGYYRLRLTSLRKTNTASDGLQNYQVVLSSNEDIQLKTFDLLVGCKTAEGVSNTTSVPMDVVSIAPYQNNLKVGFRPLSGYTYSIKITTPKGGQIIYSYNNDIGTETFNTSESANSNLSYDSGLDFKWIDFSGPQFGRYTMTVIIDIDLSLGSQIIYVLLALIAEGKIDQVDLNVNIQQTGSNTAVGTAHVGFNYFEEYQFKVVMDPIIRDGYSRIPRNITQTINVEVSPNPLPPNEYISLELITDTGTFGAAVFDNNGSETQLLQITSSQVVRIKGKQHSSKKENILLLATNKTNILASQRFSVRTWPKKFRQINGYKGDGILHFDYIWDSESNNYDDVKGLIIGEIVTYSGDCIIKNDHFEPNSPPYNGTILHYPKIKEYEITGMGFPDEHGFLVSKDFNTAFIKPYQSNVIIGEQFYRFRDPVIMDIGKYENIKDPHYIRRNVYEDPINSGIWKYRIEKDGIIAERILP